MACPASILHSFPPNPPNQGKFISSSSLPTPHLKASFRDRAFHTSHFQCFFYRRDQISSSSPQNDEGPSKKAIIPGEGTVAPTDLDLLKQCARLVPYDYTTLQKAVAKLKKVKNKVADVVKEAMKGIGVCLLLFMLQMHVDGFYM